MKVTIFQDIPGVGRVCAGAIDVPKATLQSVANLLRTHYPRAQRDGPLFAAINGHAPAPLPKVRRIA